MKVQSLNIISCLLLLCGGCCGPDYCTDYNRYCQTDYQMFVGKTCLPPPPTVCQSSCQPDYNGVYPEQSDMLADNNYRFNAQSGGYYSEPTPSALDNRPSLASETGNTTSANASNAVADVTADLPGSETGNGFETVYQADPNGVQNQASSEHTASLAEAAAAIGANSNTAGNDSAEQAQGQGGQPLLWRSVNDSAPNSTAADTTGESYSGDSYNGENYNSGSYNADQDRYHQPYPSRRESRDDDYYGRDSVRGGYTSGNNPSNTYYYNDNQSRRNNRYARSDYDSRYDSRSRRSMDTAGSSRTWDSNDRIPSSWANNSRGTVGNRNYSRNDYRNSGEQGYADRSYASNGYSGRTYGSQGYGSQGYGSQGYGNSNRYPSETTEYVGRNTTSSDSYDSGNYGGRDDGNFDSRTYDSSPGSYNGDHDGDRETNSDGIIPGLDTSESPSMIQPADTSLPSLPMDLTGNTSSNEADEVLMPRPRSNRVNHDRADFN